jgi:hypothetical protein
MTCEIFSDGKAVWVNGGHGLIGRFGRCGIDVHNPIPENGVTCICCIHRRPDSAD